MTCEHIYVDREFGERVGFGEVQEQGGWEKGALVWLPLEVKCMNGSNVCPTLNLRT